MTYPFSSMGAAHEDATPTPQVWAEGGDDVGLDDDLISEIFLKKSATPTD